MNYTLLQFETYHRLAIRRLNESRLWDVQVGRLLHAYGAGDDKARESLNTLQGDLNRTLH